MRQACVLAVRAPVARGSSVVMQLHLKPTIKRAGVAGKRRRQGGYLFYFQRLSASHNNVVVVVGE